ncbi:hypothetical protein Aperf_G00000055671 [Anoplocephala perfoliata]
MNHSNNTSDSNNTKEDTEKSSDSSLLNLSGANANHIQRREMSQKDRGQEGHINTIELKHSDGTDDSNSRIEDDHVDEYSFSNMNDGHEYPGSLPLSHNIYSSDSLLDVDERFDCRPPTFTNATVIVDRISDEKPSYFTIINISTELELDVNEAGDQIYLKPTDFDPSSSDSSMDEDDDCEYSTDDQRPALKFYVVNPPFHLLPVSPRSSDEDDDDELGLPEGKDSSHSSDSNKEI